MSRHDSAKYRLDHLHLILFPKAEFDTDTCIVVLGLKTSNFNLNIVTELVLGNEPNYNLVGNCCACRKHEVVPPCSQFCDFYPTMFKNVAGLHYHVVAKYCLSRQ